MKAWIEKVSASISRGPSSRKRTSSCQHRSAENGKILAVRCRSAALSALNLN